MSDLVDLTSRIAQLSPDKRALLELIAEQRRRPDPNAIPKRPDASTAPLSFAQERVWFLEQLDPGHPTYTLPLMLRLETPLEEAWIDAGLTVLARRHEALRTTFDDHGGRPWQVISPESTPRLQVIDLTRGPAGAFDEEVREIARRLFQQPFDLRTGPLFRTTLVNGPDAQVVLFAMHHLVSDGWSIDLLAEEMFECCAAFAAGSTPRLPEPSLQFGDYAAWQREWFAGAVAARQLEYWSRQLGGLTTLDLPTDCPRPAAATYRGRTTPFVFAAGASAAARELARRHDATLFMTLLTAFFVLLHRYTRQDDLAVGSPVANRTRRETERVVGFFANTLVLRVDAHGAPAFSVLLARVKEVVFGAHANQDVPFERLVEVLQPERDPSRNPLFQVMFAVQKPSRLSSASGGEGSIVQVPVDPGSSKFDLTVTVQEMHDALTGTIEYNTDLFTQATIDRMVRHFQRVLTGAATDPAASIDRLALLEDVERETLRGWNQTAVAWPVEGSLAELLEAQAARTPDAPAVWDASRTLTYRELNGRANRLARHLRGLGVGPESIAGVGLERSADLVVALLAVLKAGAAYLPLDPTHPPERLAFMLDDARAAVVLSRTDLLGAADFGPDVPVESLDRIGPRLQALSPDNLEPLVALDGAAYVIYTSGSTGRPKGVVTSHRGIVNRLRWMQSAYQLTGADRVVQKTPCTFDVSVWEFFWPLMTGACLVVARPEGHRDPSYLVELIRATEATTVHFVPSMLQLFLEHPAAGGCRSLTRIMCSGEALPFELKELCLSRLPARLFNLYGPTEASVDVTAIECLPDDRDRRSVTIGRPIANTAIHVIDDAFEEVPIGVPGEIAIGGVGLARGYLGRPDLTAGGFVPDPFASSPGGRLYLTGDLGRWRDEGVIEFLGRRDHQVKLRGVRIEPGEIEAVLLRQPGVRHAAVVLQPAPGGDTRLVAYLVAADQETIDLDQVTAGIRRSLPGQLIPSAFVVLPALPLTSSGKLNRAALPLPVVTPRGAGRAPRDLVEEQIAGIWRTLLPTDHVGVDDDFFALGGHSLLAARVIAGIREGCGVEIPLRAMFASPTVADLADAVRQVKGGHTWSEARLPPGGLDREAVLPADVRPPDGAGAAAASGRVLLTGATGFLGAFLLERLLQRMGATVLCLVRADSPQEGRERLERTLRSHGLWDGRFAERIVPVCGDLSAPRLGLSDDDFGTLASTIDAVYHNGALVNFLYPYRRLKAANVEGTIEVLRLACRVRLLPVHYVSTIDVLGDRVPTADEEDPLDSGDGLRIGYAQSKWVAERLMQRARERGLPVAIYRPARIVGDSRSGAWNVDDFGARVIKGCIQIGLAPARAPWDNMSPVDFVSAAIVHLSSRSEATGRRAFHVINPRWFFWTRMIEFVRSRGYELREVPYAEWREQLAAACAEDDRNVLKPLLALFPPAPAGSVDEPGNDAAVLDLPAPHCRNTVAGLEGSGIECPEVDDGLLSRYFEFFVRVGFLPDPQRAAVHPAEAV